MIPESFETIMARNNTTLPAAQNTGADEKNMAASTFAKTHKKNTAMLAAFSLALCFCLLSTAGAASVHNRRSVRSITANANVKHCHQNTPCGWAIYIPFTRRIDYFMRNTCDCDSTLACLKTDDDLSVNAYVYRCRTRPLSTTTDGDILPAEGSSSATEDGTSAIEDTTY